MKRAYVIGIAGPSAGGKSTLALALRDRLPELQVRLIHMDEYFLPEGQRPRIAGITDGLDYRDDNHPDALDLERCRMDAAEAAQGCWDAVITEELFALWDEALLPLLDLKLYVDCDSGSCMARRVSRNLSFRQELNEILTRYAQAVLPRQREYVEPSKWRADLILNGSTAPETGLELAAEHIRRACSEGRGANKEE